MLCIGLRGPPRGFGELVIWGVGKKTLNLGVLGSMTKQFQGAGQIALFSGNKGALLLPHACMGGPHLTSEFFLVYVHYSESQVKSLFKHLKMF